jgi:hypothetical protein
MPKAANNNNLEINNNKALVNNKENKNQVNKNLAMVIKNEKIYYLS